MKLLNGLLEAEGSTSSVRVGMLVCICTACYIAAMGFDDITADQVKLISALLGFGFGGKLVQKKFEAEER